MKNHKDNGDQFDDSYDDMTEYYHEAGWTGFVYPSATWGEIVEAANVINLRNEPHRKVEATADDWLDTWCYIQSLAQKGK